MGDVGRSYWTGGLMGGDVLWVGISYRWGGLVSRRVGMSCR